MRTQLDGARTSMPWNEQETAELKVLWGDGYSGSDISVELFRKFGFAVSRQAVIRKAHRLGIKRRDAGAQDQEKKPRDHEARPQPIKMGNIDELPGVTTVRNADQTDITRPLLPPVNLDLLSPTTKAVLDIEDKQCRWPVGEPSSPEFKFCGCATATGRTYCEHHERLAYQPASERKITQANASKTLSEFLSKGG